METLVLMCLASHFDIIESWKLNVWHRGICYAKKILNAFVCVEVTILVEKWNVYEGHIFPRPLLQTCWLETTSLCVNTRLLVNKNFQILIIFIEINVNVCLLCPNHVMTSIILNARRCYCQYEGCYALGIYVKSDFLYSNFEGMKKTFLTSIHFAPRCMH